MRDLEPLRDVSVAILSCNRREELRATLHGLLARGPIWREIVVADNASTDGTPSMVREAFPDAQVIETGGNLGVAGLNRAFASSSGRWVLSLDDDSCPDLDTWGPLAESLKDESRYAAITCSVRAHPAGRAEAGDTRLKPYFGFHQAGGLLRRELIQRLDGFDESLFLWGVELHLTAQAILAGFQMARSETAVVVHRATPLNRSSRRHAFHYCRNLFLLLLRHAPAEQRRQLVETYLSRVVLFSLLHHTRTYIRSIRDGLRIHRLQQSAARSLTPDQFRELAPDLRSAFSFLG